MSLNKLVFIMPVWGDLYTEWLLKYSIPSQLSNDNLPAVTKLSNTTSPKYLIYTTSDHVDIIKESSSYKKLSEIIKTEIIVDDEMQKLKLSHKMVNRCFRHTVEVSDSDDYAIVSLSPDIVYSNGSLLNMIEHALKGKRLILFGHLRVKDEPVIRELDSQTDKNGIISLSSRELVRIGIKHMHNVFKSKLWDSSRFTVHPCILFWQIDEKGLLGRFFHLAFCYFNPRNKKILLDVLKEDADKTIDGSELLDKSFPNDEEIHVSEDSEDFFAIELCSETHANAEIPDGLKESSILDVAIWASNPGNVSPIHLKFAGKKIRLHSSEISDEWGKIEMPSDETMTAITATVNLFKQYPDIRVEIEDVRQKTHERNNLDNSLKALSTTIEYCEDLINTGELYRAYRIFEDLLGRTNFIKGTIMNNMAIIQANMGRPVAAENILNYLINEGYPVEEAKKNLEIVRSMREISG